MAEKVDIVARATGDRFVAPQSNRALDLANSLRDLSPTLNQTLVTVGNQLKERQESDAKRDVLRASGKKFADAVREGKIRGSQNPWYVAAYNKESAQVRSRTQLAELQTQSQTWEEKNNPAAFQERWNKELAAASEGYQQIDEQEGFQTEANVASQHVIESNTRLNMNRIEQERADNLGKLVADTVRQVNAANAGNASAEQVFASLADLHTRAIATGGTEEEWDRIVQNGVVSAAYNAQDADLIDLLKHAREGRGSVYDIPGVADAVEADKFRIRSNADSAIEARNNAARLKLAESGNKAVDAAYDVFGADIIRGTADPDAIIKSLESSGFDGRSIGYALNDIQRTVSDSRSLSQARMTGNTAIVDLYLRARQKGYSPQLKTDITNAIVAGTIDANDGIRFLDTAIDKNRQAQQDVDQDEQRSVGKASRESTQLRMQLDQLESLVVVELGKTGARLSSNRRDTFEQALTDSALAYLSANPDDYNGALQTAQDKAADLLTTEIARRQGASAGSTTSSTPSVQGNPRR